MPRVSIGIPVRNGGEKIKVALESILNQTENNIEIIIADNKSDDGTSGFLSALAARDPRVSYYRHDDALTAFENFEFVLSKSSGQYFMWAAHDDSRNIEFIERLGNFLDNSPRSILAFGDVYVCTESCVQGTKYNFNFSTVGLSVKARLRKTSNLQFYNFYGLWRTESIKKVFRFYCSWWPDLPIMMASAIQGEFAYVEGANFYYFEINKTNRTRVREQDFKESFNLFSAVWELHLSTYIACRKVGGTTISLYAFTCVLFKHLRQLPGHIYRIMKNRKFS